MIIPEGRGELHVLRFFLHQCEKTIEMALRSPKQTFGSLLAPDHMYSYLFDPPDPNFQLSFEKVGTSIICPVLIKVEQDTSELGANTDARHTCTNL